MHRARAAKKRGPLSQPSYGQGHVAVEREWLGGSRVVLEAGFPIGSEGGELFDDGAVVVPAGWDRFVVEAVAVGEPADPLP